MVDNRVEKFDQEWKQELGDEVYVVCWLVGMERVFSGKYWDLKDEGVYYCVCCEMFLF